MKRLLVRLLYGNGKFRSYEQIIIDKVIQVLEPTTADILRHQLEASDIKQRSSLDKMLIIGFSFERLDYQGLLFPNRSDELRIATVKLRALNSRRQIKVEIVAAEGLIATMKFSHSPRELEDGFEIIEVEVGPAPQVPEVPVEPLDHVPASLSLHLSGYEIRNCIPPKNHVSVREFLENFETAVPQDFIQLLAITDGFKIGTLEFSGTHSRKIPLPDRTLILAAEDEEMAVCFVEGQTEPLVYLYNQIDDELAFGGNNFIPTLRAVLPEPE